MFIKNKYWGNLLISIIILMFLSGLGLLLIVQAPEVRKLQKLDIQLDSNGDLPNKEVVLGWAELGQNPGYSSAEKSHLKVTHTQESGWLLQNVATRKRIDAQTQQIPTRFIRRFALQAGDQLLANSWHFLVVEAQDGRLVLENTQTGTQAEWAATRLVFDDNRTLYEACEQSDSLKRTMKNMLDAWQWQDHQSIKEEKRLFSIGGQVNCTTRWPHEHLPAGSLVFSWMDKRFWLSSKQADVRFKIIRNNETFVLNKSQLAVHSSKDGTVSRLIIGRTYYALSATQHQLSLKPIRNIPVSFIENNVNAVATDTQTIDTITSVQSNIEHWHKLGIFPVFSTYAWIGETVHTGIIGKSDIIIASLALALFLLPVLKATPSTRAEPTKIKWLVIFGTLGVFLISIVVVYQGLSLTWLLALTLFSALWASISQFLNQRLDRRSALIWWLILLLSGIGLLVLSQLAAGSSNTRWLNFPYENAFWLIQINLWVSLLSLISLEKILNALMGLLSPEKYLRQYKHFSIPHPIYSFFIITVLSLLVIQVLAGKEEGVLGIQPVELGKLLFIVIMARLVWSWNTLLLTYSNHFRQNQRKIFLKLSLPMLIAIALGGIILMVGVNDNSPLFIVFWITIAYLWLACIDPLKKWSRIQIIGHGTIGTIVVLIILLGFYAYNNPPGYDSNFPQAERIRIWANPYLYPEASSQLLNSLKRIGEGGWFGIGWFGKNDIAMSLPAVQDDFIGAFLINHFGGVAAAFLLILQFIWLYLLFSLFRKLINTRIHAEINNALQLIAYLLFGLTIVHLLHWFISWSNILGWMPIMGQPMTWLSSGNSHLLAIGAITVMVSLIASWLLNAVNKQSSPH